MGRIEGSVPPSKRPGSVLLVDDDPLILRALQRTLERSELSVEPYSNAEAALNRIEAGGVDVVVCDITLPGMTGIELLRRIHEREPDLPVVLMTGNPGIESATEAINYGVHKYLVKPVQVEALREAVAQARHLYRMACVKREAVLLLGGSEEAGDRSTMQQSFELALDSLWMAFQPLVRAKDGSVFGYEALLRSGESALPGPADVLSAAERLGEMPRLGRRARERAAAPLLETPGDEVLFVNLHPEDLADPELGSLGSALTRISERVVLEVTERASLESVENVRERVRSLREVGFRIAVDDLGAGYAGLTSFALLEPEFVKIDMTLTRDIDTSSVKQRLVRTLTGLCADMGMTIVVEGVETPAERDTLGELGCDLLQGYLFAKPGRPFPTPVF